MRRCVGGGVAHGAGRGLRGDARGSAGFGGGRPEPDEHLPAVVGGDLLHVDQLFLDVLERLFIERELALQHPIGDAAVFFQKSTDLSDDLEEVHRAFSWLVSHCATKAATRNAASSDRRRKGGEPP